MENDSSTSHSERRQKPASSKSLWLLAAGILIVEAALRLMPAGLMERTINLRMHEIATLPAPKVQIMGDSVSAGINAANFEEAAHLPAGTVENYALPGTSPLFAYFTLRRELAAGRTPGRIIFAPHPANLEMAMEDRFMGRFATVGESLELLRNGVSPSDWLFGAACRASIAMRNREEYRAVLTEGNLGFFKTLRKLAISVRVSETKINAPATPPPPLAWPAETFPAELSTAFSVDRVNATYIDKFCALAAEHHIPVIWVTVPVIAMFNDRAMGNGGAEKYEAYLRGLAARHANVTLLHPQIEVYPDNCFADPWHLNPYGALKFSEALGAAMSAEQSRLAVPAESAK